MHTCIYGTSLTWYLNICIIQSNMWYIVFPCTAFLWCTYVYMYATLQQAVAIPRGGCRGVRERLKETLTTTTRAVSSFSSAVRSFVRSACGQFVNPARVTAVIHPPMSLRWLSRQLLLLCCCAHLCLYFHVCTYNMICKAAVILSVVYRLVRENICVVWYMMVYIYFTER